MARTLHSMVLLALSLIGGCAHSTIPNTDVEDTGENRDVLQFVERYRHAVEERNVSQMLELASERYFDDNGTPLGDDDIDYRKLREALTVWRDRVIDVRYEIRYRRVAYDRDRVFVDYTYTGSFLVQTPDGERWQRRLRDNRLVLRKGGESYRILSGM